MSHPSYSVNELRERFLRFFESKGHLRLPSFSLIPQNDKSVLLINAGMTPMKPWFKGEEEPPRRRVCTCQKCIRTGDIDNVGHTARHGTYFEMLGNFSFGDYFKKDAIAWSWEFLTSPEWAGLEPERLYPSVYQDDDEAWKIWNEDIGIPPERIFRFGKEDNFWEHGAGPCGPCSEIYYDRGPEYGCGKPGCTVGCDCDRYIEVWNNVFTQFDNDGHDNYTELKQKNIDTGMGLERLAVVSQNVDSLFDVDTVMQITNHVSALTGARYGQSHEKDVSLRVITDHIRSATFMICDGVLPSNEGRGYVLRRLLRRAARHGKLLGVNEPFLHEIVETVVAVNEGEYTDLREKKDYITRVIRTEEENFARTLDGGMHIFAEMLARCKAEGRTAFSGADAFKLYDTYGFPVDMTADMARDEGLGLDEEAFAKLMEEQRERARKAREALGDLGWADVDFGSEVPSSVFVGYDHAAVDDAKIVALVVEGAHAETLMPGVEAIVVLDKTPFYAEMGGQVADHGEIRVGAARFVVTDVQKNRGGKYMHYGTLSGGELHLGDTVTAAIDTERRQAIMRAHSATHLLDAALRAVLGEHVHQAGSLVEADRLRFDFTHFSAVTQEELDRVSEMVNRAILSGYPVRTEELPIEEAKQRGAIALFGEKYGDIVRVVDMGDGFSVEFCGGTHLDNTAKVGVFQITNEFSVASGVRRIEATTGLATLEGMHEARRTLMTAAAELKTRPEELIARLEQHMETMRELRRTLEQFRAREIAGETDRFLYGAHNVGGLLVVTAMVPAAAPEKLRQMGDTMRDKAGNAVVVLATVNDGKLSFLASCGAEAVKKGIRAGDIIKSVTAVCGGKGGGRPDSAMGGGGDVMKADNALAIVDDFVKEKLEQQK
ncbi:MAG: alanine--tRNA ligase [Oscillospiraceae bacterium]|nr:alanine--tRNA ligase [Oscillospiraceae bacterium]